jgi:hypothetical protein
MTRPPSGAPAPTYARLGGVPIDLLPLAEEVAARYFDAFPDDLKRYGDAARAWEIHDTSYCLEWAILDVEGLADVEREVAWLSDILRSRDFPLERLERNLQLAAEVVGERLGEPGAPVAARLRAGGACVGAG